MFKTDTHKKLACLIITLPFYAHAQEEPTQLKKQPDLIWNFTVQRTTPEITQEWLQLIADYAKAGHLFFDEMHDDIQKLLKDILGIANKNNYDLSLTLDDSGITTGKNKLLPFIGQRLTDFIQQPTLNDGIHGELGVAINIDLLKPKPKETIQWILTIHLDDNHDRETFDKIKDDFTALTNELNTPSLTSDNQNYGSLLHNVTATAQQTHAYACNATLTLKP